MQEKQLGMIEPEHQQIEPNRDCTKPMKIQQENEKH